MNETFEEISKQCMNITRKEFFGANWQKPSMPMVWWFHTRTTPEPTKTNQNQPEPTRTNQNQPEPTRNHPGTTQEPPWRLRETIRRPRGIHLFSFLFYDGPIPFFLPVLPLPASPFPSVLFLPSRRLFALIIVETKHGIQP